jgi:predicted P-loop ATPase
MKVSDRDLDSAINISARVRPFHPIRDYVDGLVRDGKPRLATVWIDHLGAPDDTYHRETAEKWFTAGVGRVYEPGLRLKSVKGWIVGGKFVDGRRTRASIVERDFIALDS